MSYEVIVAKIDTIKNHGNADRLKIATVLGYQVIVGLDSQVGDVVLLFPDDGQLSTDYCTANDLIAYKDEQGNKKGGYFDHNRKIRVQKFRGEKSEAYVAPLTSLEFTGYDISKLKIGDKFSELNSIPICNKYLTKATKEAGQNKKKKDKKEKEFTKRFNKHLKSIFPEHFDTQQFRHYADMIPKDSMITITSKLHGTSARTAYIPVIVKLNWFQNIINKLFFGGKDHYKYDYVNGTRRVVLTKDGGDGFYHNTSFRDNCLEKFKGKLNKNEIVYYEIVGFTDTGTSIMPSVNTEKLKDKEFTKRFGKVMTYKYGCLEGTCDIYIYRMCVINEDGVKEELSWDRVKYRCAEIGVKTVPEICRFKNDNSVDIKEIVEYHTEQTDQADPIDPSHIKEGICIRVDDSNGGTKIYKNKTFWFKCCESNSKEQNDIDIEEAENIE